MTMVALQVYDPIDNPVTVDDQALVDTRVTNFVNQLPMDKQAKKWAVDEFFKKLPREVEQTQARQRTLQQIIDDDGTRQQLETIVSHLDDLQRCRSFSNRDSFGHMARTVNQYAGAVEGLAGLPEHLDGNLGKLRDHFKDVVASIDYKYVKLAADRTKDIKSITLKIGVNDTFSPTSYHVVGFSTDAPEPMPLMTRLSRFLRSLDNRVIAGRFRDFDTTPQTIHNYCAENLGPIFKDAFRQLDEPVDQLLRPLQFSLGITDYCLSHAKTYSVTIPTMLPAHEQRFDVTRGVNPGMFDEVRGKPQRIGASYDATNNMFMLTGEHSGGKTSYLRFVGAMTIMAQSGSFVFAEQATASMRDNIFTYFIEAGSQGHGAHETEMRKMRTILDHATPDSIILLDEVCKQTGAVQGLDQATNIFNALYRLNVPTFAVTHNHELAQQVNRWEGTTMLRPVYRDGKSTYGMEVGMGESDAARIAQETNMTPLDISRLLEEKQSTHGSSMRQLV